ncbi:MAG: hypothetical protein LBT74_04700 [Acidobacteriota bacterium]|jgi:hypothetical protein|nr:hypothetical protein [Acidobacteriota bacterium]
MNLRRCFLLLMIVVPAALAFLGIRSAMSQRRGTPAGNAEKAGDKPIALPGDEVGDLLRKWYAAGTAAGNVGDYYDNRDEGHSQLDLASYPQLQQISYTEDQVKARANWGAQSRLIAPDVVFGNSSTSLSAAQGGSNPRGYYVRPSGIVFLFGEYVRNNLYIYPEHQDYDPGHNGYGDGYGDLYPANTPYLIISQGSSGSDQPFMRAVPRTLAAFRPEVKQKLRQSGMLFPAVQMLLRLTGRQLAGEGEYLTGKAHPPVFDGANVNERKMVELAHAMTADDLPPMAQIHVAREDDPVLGLDYFEPEKTERLGDTPAAVARVFRGTARTRKVTVDAGKSKDLGGKPVKFFWTVLQGDASRIKIEYRNPEHSVAEVTIPYFDRFPVSGKPGMETNRVDIGVFVHNGKWYSPPAFLTFFTLDSEARTYDADGRVVDVGYGVGTASVSVADWAALLRMLGGEGAGWRERLLRGRFDAEELAALRKVAAEFSKADAAAIAARTGLERAEASNQAVDAARRSFEDAKGVGERILQSKLPKSDVTVAARVRQALDGILHDVGFMTANVGTLQPLLQSAGRDDLADFDSCREALVRSGVLRKSPAGGFDLTPVRGGGAPLATRLTRFEKGEVARLNASLLAHVIYPRIVRDEWRANYVDARLDTPKAWRDVYRYAPDGTMLGWTRYSEDGVQRFNAEGLLSVAEDGRGRCVKAMPVSYEKVGGVVKAVPTQEVREYSYSGPDDWKGVSKS